MEADVVNQLRQTFDSVSGGDGFIDMADLKRAAVQKNAAASQSQSQRGGHI